MQREPGRGRQLTVLVALLIMGLTAGAAAIVGGRPILGGVVLALVAVGAAVLALHERGRLGIGLPSVASIYSFTFIGLSVAALATGSTVPAVVLLVCGVWIWFFTARPDHRS